MICKAIGNYKVFEVERGDMVVVMGQVGEHRAFLADAGFEEHPETKEWVGTGAGLYGMTPEAFTARFGVAGELRAQVTDGERFCAVDALPQVGEDAEGRPVIVKVLALELDTREVIDQVMSRMMERG